MKRSLTFKSVLATTSLVSLFAFAFVNIRADSTLTPVYSKMEMTQNQVETEEDADSRKIPVPDVSVIGRVWDIAQRLLDKAN
ncbi:MAG: hypothetical protein Q7T20_00660 [Saprospiraceae bacterium]|nr:hypothetical protein [Saprospiraceae bacterium]